eukprot:g3492.t1
MTDFDEYDENQGSESSYDDSEVEEDEKSVAERAMDLKNMGNDKYRSGDFYGAIDLYTEAIKLTPDNAAFYGNRAAARLSVSQFEKAVSDAEKATEIDPNFLKGYLRAATAYLKLGEFDASEKQLTLALIRDPRDKKALQGRKDVKTAREAYSNAQSLLETGNHRKAYAAVQKAMESCPASKELHLLKLTLMVQRKLFSEAITYSTQLMRDSMNTNDVLTLRAECFYYMNNFPLAVKHLTQVLRRDPDHKAVQSRLKLLRKLERTKKEGNDAYKRQQWAAAIHAYTKCLEMDPKHDSFNAILYSNRAACLTNQRQFARAIFDCNEAIARNPQYTKAYMRRAAAFFEKGDKHGLESCVRDYEKVLQMMGHRSEGARDVKEKLRRAKVALKRANRKDFYRILGVKNSATESEIKKGYRKMAIKWHPDKQGGKSEAEKKVAEQTFKDVNEAYSVLSDREKRGRYDRGEDLECCGGGGGGGMSQADLFQMFMRRGGGGFGF